MSNPNFVPTFSTDEVYVGQDSSKCLTDELEGFATTDHNHTGVYAPTTHSHTDKADLVNGKVPVSQIPDEMKEIRIVANIAARDAMTGLFAGLSVFVTDASADSTVTSGGAYYMYDGTGWIKTAEAESMDIVLQWANIQGKPATYPPESHTHAAQAITGHMGYTYYSAPAGNAYTNIPLTTCVATGNALTIVDNQVRIGAGISKVMISAQLCVGSSNITYNKFIAIRKNAVQQLARAQMKLYENTTPQTMAIPPLLVDVVEGDLLTLDFWGELDDTIYGDCVLTYLTVEKVA